MRYKTIERLKRLCSYTVIQKIQLEIFNIKKLKYQPRSGTENLGMLETKLESLELERFGLVRYSIPDRQREGRFLGITGEKAVSCMF